MAIWQKYGKSLVARAKTRTFWLMAALLALGLLLRLLGLDFGLPSDSRPDEIPIVQIVMDNLLSAMMLRGDFSLHPHFLNYPSLYFYLMAALFGIFYGVGHLMGWFPSWLAFQAAYEWDHTPFHLILRGFSVVAGTLLIGAMFLLGRRWSPDSRVSWLVALLAATNYLLVRNSHFGSVDMLMTLGVVVALWGILRYMQQRTEKSLYVACILSGLAVGTKYPAALLLLPLWVALLKPFVDARRIDWPGFFHAVWKPTGLVAVVFFWTSPWILLDFPRFLRDFYYESANFFTYSFGGIESGWLFYPLFTLPVGVGGLVLLFSAIGLWVRWRSNEDRWADAALLSFLVGSFVLLGFNERVMTRYALPMIPVFLLFAAEGICYGADVLHRLLASRLSLSNRMATGLVTMLTVIQPLTLSVGFDQLMMQADTRTLARRWIMQTVPPNTPVANGPRLGQLYLPGNYGQLVVQNGPDTLEAPRQNLMQDITPRTRLIASYRDLDKLRELGIRYVVTYEGIPAFSNRPSEVRHLMENAALVFQASPLKPNARPEDVGRFDPMDAFFLPYADFSAFERPGPLIRIFDLNRPPLQEAIGPVTVPEGPDKSGFPAQDE